MLNTISGSYSSRAGVPRRTMSSRTCGSAWRLPAETFTAQQDFIAAKMTPAQIAEAQKLAHEWKPTTGASELPPGR
jgi:hypothetical protein